VPFFIQRRRVGTPSQRAVSKEAKDRFKTWST